MKVMNIGNLFFYMWTIAYASVTGGRISYVMRYENKLYSKNHPLDHLIYTLVEKYTTEGPVNAWSFRSSQYVNETV